MEDACRTHWHTVGIRPFNGRPQTWCVHPCLAQLSATLPNLVRTRRVASSSAHVQPFLSLFQNATNDNLALQQMHEGIANTKKHKQKHMNAICHNRKKEHKWARHAASLDAQVVTNRTQELHGHATKRCLAQQTFCAIVNMENVFCLTHGP